MRPVVYAVLALALLLALVPFAVPKPGLPLSMKADEPAYYLAALSLAKDRDLRVELHDIQRLAEEYSYNLPVNNLILMTDDGWRTVYYGKPYIYSLFAAPFAAIGGANGMVSFNLLLLVAMIAMGTAYLRQYNDEWLALLFAFGFVLVSTAWVYGFWLHPEVFNMAAITASLYLGFHRPTERPAIRRWWSPLAAIWLRPGVRAAASGAVLALAVYNKPMLAALGIPSLLALAHARRWRDLGLWLAGAAASMAVICGIALVLTGHPSAYLGVLRQGVSVREYDSLPVHPISLDAPQLVAKSASWHWMFRIPEIDPRVLATDLKYFLVGRHTGLFVYAPFTLICLLLFLGHRRRDAVRWGLLASLFAVALAFLVWIPFNWHGGGGFVGNRYFVNAVPGFLFLVTRITPAWTPLLGYGVGGLLLGQLLLAPLSAPVLHGTLQAHVRGAPFGWLPMELSLTSKIPGYRGTHQEALYVWGRREEFRPQGDEVWIAGGRRVEVWIQSLEPLEELLFQVDNLAPENEIVVAVPGDRQRVELPERGSKARQRARVVLRPTKPTTLHEVKGTPIHYYRMTVSTRTGRLHRHGFFLGAALTYLGTTEQLGLDVFAAEWLDCAVPATAQAGETLTLPFTLANRSAVEWPVHSRVRVELGWRWLHADGSASDLSEGRARFVDPVAPGGQAAISAEIVVPDEPGTYILELDPLYRRVAWFSKRQPDSACHRTVEVIAGPGGAVAEPARARVNGGG